MLLLCHTYKSYAILHTVFIFALPLFLNFISIALTFVLHLCPTCNRQWHRQDLLQEGAKTELLFHGTLTVDFRAGCSSCSMPNSL